MMSLFIRFCILKNKKCSIFFTCCTHQSRIRKQGFCPGKIGWLIYADFLNQSSEYTFFFCSLCCCFVPTQTWCLSQKRGCHCIIKFLLHLTEQINSHAATWPFLSNPHKNV